MYSSNEVLQRSWEGYFGVYFPSCFATREINTKIALEWVQKPFGHDSTYIVLFLTRYNESINDDKNGDL